MSLSTLSCHLLSPSHPCSCHSSHTDLLLFLDCFQLVLASGPFYLLFLLHRTFSTQKSTCLIPLLHSDLLKYFLTPKTFPAYTTQNSLLNPQPLSSYSMLCVYLLTVCSKGRNISVLFTVTFPGPEQGLIHSKFSITAVEQINESKNLHLYLQSQRQHSILGQEFSSVAYVRFVSFL